MVGGLIRLGFEKSKKEKKDKERMISDGMLYCSGMIAGEGIVGILLAVFAVFNIDKVIDLSGKLNLSEPVATIGSLVVFALIILLVLKFSLWKKKKESK